MWLFYSRGCFSIWCLLRKDSEVRMEILLQLRVRKQPWNKGVMGIELRGGIVHAKCFRLQVSPQSAWLWLTWHSGSWWSTMMGTHGIHEGKCSHEIAQIHFQSTAIKCTGSSQLFCLLLGDTGRYGCRLEDIFSISEGKWSSLEYFLSSSHVCFGQHFYAPFSEVY